MDSLKFLPARTRELLADRRFRGFAIGALILAVVTVLQVSNLNKNKPMCDLFANCKLASGEIQRMQIALSQSGLSEFKIENDRLLVPSAQHSSYLQAVAEHDAVPHDLQEDHEKTPNVNPFLSRSQQIALERSEKKRQIREMVVRLPFVDQAWFEMDQSSSHSAFEKSKQSAVVSIRTAQRVALNEQQVDTVQRMISGAIAGLNPEGIVVIDLSAGFAHQDLIDPSTTQQVRFQRIAFEQQRFYENRIQDILKDYPGVTVRVHVDVSENAEQNKLIAQQREMYEQMAREQIAAAQNSANRIETLPQAGANGFASIAQMEEPAAETATQPAPFVPPVIQTAYNSSEASNAALKKSISVSIDVPQKLVHDLFGSPVATTSTARHPSYNANPMQETQSKFAQLQSEIVYKVRQVLPESTFEDRSLFPISVNMIRQPIPTKSNWMESVKKFAAQNWPSAAVLAIGLMLLTIVTRNPETPPSVSDNEVESQDYVSLSSDGLPEVEGNFGNNAASPENANPEVRLTKLIEKDPDAAAKVIEAWIRDAA